MAQFLYATVICSRGQVTPLVSPTVSGRNYVIENGSQGDNLVQYWGTLFHQVDDTSESRYPYEIRQSLQLYRRAHLLIAAATATPFVGYYALWIPREYRLSSAIIRVFQY